MKLVIGGAYQNKKETACRLFGIAMEDMADGTKCSPEEVFSCRAVCNFHRLILRKIQAGENPCAYGEKLMEKNPGLIVVTDEIGYGVVPLDREERLWREQTGRVCCQLAARADTVVRVMAGIPLFLKGEAP